MLEKISGIYCIENVVNGKKYIGCAVDIHDRISRHFRDLGNGNHHSSYLQNSFNKYGVDIFSWHIIQELPPEEELLGDMEIYWIAYYNSFHKDGGGYNMTRGGYYGVLGYVPTEEAREKMRNWTRTPEMFIKITETKRRNGITSWNKGIPATEEAKKYLSEVRRGMKLSEENCQAIANGIQGLKRQKNTSSKYVGVKFSKQKNKWISEIFFKKERIHIGTFLYEVEAALAYNEFALELYGYKATLNIISQKEIDNLWNLE